MTSDPNRVSAEFGGQAHAGQLVALEGQGGLMRVQVDAAQLEIGQSGVLQMHDGARFGVVVVEPLGEHAAGHEYRLKLTGRA
ncbi:hypothetical protein [Deinococcus sp.]|uniref:hypothetical protein n=1 Tax=Deinococcus sp. TaxID=47478 RepID=UPI003B5BDE60